MLSIPRYPLGWVVLSNGDSLRPLGLTEPLDQLLGQGTFGAAYKVELHGTSVLKLTSDPTEVQAACLLQGRVNKRIVGVHAVWALLDTLGREGDDLQPWYVIHRDHLNLLNATDKGLIELLFELYDDTSLDLTIPRSPKQHVMIAKWRGYIRDILMGGGGTFTDDEGNTGGIPSMGAGKYVKRTMQLLLQIGTAVDEMHRVGIAWEDIHSDNLMRDDNGRLVIGDIGMGQMHAEFKREVVALTPDLAKAYAAEKVQAAAR